MNLDELASSTRFYDQRYGAGYMEDWPEEKKARVAALIRGLGLAATGRALDFGCGNGVFTRVLRSALPGWEVFGCDISPTAIANAADRSEGCRFFVGDAPEFEGSTFDLVFSHHVLEHVYDLGAVATQIADRCAPGGSMFHVTPCGNPGSFEWRLCALRRDGIDPARGNRFFYEDPGHVRRLTTEEERAAFEPFGFSLAREYYANQRFGVLNWVTQSSPALVAAMFNPLKARSPLAALRLLPWLVAFGAASALRLPAVLARHFGRSRPLRIALALPALVSAPFDRLLVRMADAEWETSRHDRGGSEMYLHFVRDRWT